MLNPATDRALSSGLKHVVYASVHWKRFPCLQMGWAEALVEPFIDDYVKFNSNSGWTCNTDGWCEVGSMHKLCRVHRVSQIVSA
jgi:hypothetical protein